jgi:hypothetical protein
MDKNLGEKTTSISYTSGLGAATATNTRYLVNHMLAKVINSNYAPFNAHVLCSHPIARCASAGTPTLSVADGSDVVIFSGAVDNVVAGSYLSIPSDAAAVTKSGDTYRVTSKDTTGLIVTLDRPFAGTTNAALACAAIPTIGTEVGQITNALMVADYATTYTGLMIVADNINDDMQLQLDPDSGFDGGETVTDTSMVMSIGDYIYVEALEKTMDAYQGVPNKINFPPDVKRYATSGYIYTILTIGYYDEKPHFDGSNTQMKQLNEIVVPVRYEEKGGAVNVNDHLDVVVGDGTPTNGFLFQILKTAGCDCLIDADELA